ncbi:MULTISPECIES: hypothetical protein [Chromobacterium]|jgi:hypothetical protein|uniref:DUF2188 domain-containing protein n=2 Tax=Chromobacterium TaxID=535 RepID=A0A1S1X7S9_9NEIS|nr:MULTISPECIES: hypothetical protein [Chromobacterium]KIA81401.1 hypothetical protein QR66_05020 [Chromobacterium piscinae]MBM2886320.1 hypothetical protein [Chromobacterium amazonense]MDE1713229.1 hypothetical protein [Chromobacterium amazonense]MDQ4542268.1 hypothetical protein [Chromobacterium amazonense]OHX15500.1 hypothetical protein BI343_18850 [Chromobacterium amazonense]
MYRLKLISPHFGIDDKGPLHPTQEQARQAAELMLRVYRGNVRAEVHRVDVKTRKTEKLEEVYIKQEWIE